MGSVLVNEKRRVATSVFLPSFLLRGDRHHVFSGSRMVWRGWGQEESAAKNDRRWFNTGGKPLVDSAFDGKHVV